MASASKLPRVPDYVHEAEPKNWKVQRDPTTKRLFFGNKKTKRTTWERPACLRTLPPRTADAGKTVLLVVDVHEETWTNRAEVRADFGGFEDATKRSIAVCRKAGVQIVWARADYRDDRSAWLANYARIQGVANPTCRGRPAVAVGETPCAAMDVAAGEDARLQWLDFATPVEGDALLAHSSWSATRDTAFIAYLRATKVETVLLQGLSTSIEVGHTAFGLRDAGFRVILVTDACADAGMKRHQMAIELYGDNMYELTNVLEVGVCGRSGGGEGGGEGAAKPRHLLARSPLALSHSHTLTPPPSLSLVCSSRATLRKAAASFPPPLRRTHGSGHRTPIRSSSQRRASSTSQAARLR